MFESGFVALLNSWAKSVVVVVVVDIVLVGRLILLLMPIVGSPDAPIGSLQRTIIHPTTIIVSIGIEIAEGGIVP